MNTSIIENYLEKFDTLKKKLFFSYNINHSGFGDFLKYFVYTLHFCINNDIKLHLDFSHPINKYFKFKFEKLYLDYTPKNGYFVRQIDDIINLYENDPNTDRDFFVLTFSVFHKDYDAIKLCNESILSDFFYFTDEVILAGNKIINNIDSFISIHLRLGDKFLETDKNYIKCQDDQRRYDEEILFNVIKNNNNNNIFFFCDNNSYKINLKNKFEFINITDLKIGHIALDNTTDIDSLNCILEFYMLTKSTRIYAVSPSGFSRFAARFNNIPYYELYNHLYR